MLKSIFRFVAFTLFQNMVRPRSKSERRSRGIVHPNGMRIKELVLRYSTLGILSFVFLLMFTGGLIVTVVATAHSFDLTNQFQATAVFWAGFGISILSIVAVGICLRAIASTQVRLDELVVTEPEPENFSLLNSFLRPMMEGVMEGLRRPSFYQTEAEHSRNKSTAA